MSRQSTNINLKESSSRRESLYWFLGGAVFLSMMLANFSVSLDIPTWVFYTVAFVLVILLVMLAPSPEPGFLPTEQPSRNLGRIFLYIAFFFALLEVVWFGLVQRDWQLLTVWLPLTLFIGLVFNLLSTAVLEKRLPYRFLVVPIASLFVGGLLALILPGFGFVNSFTLSFVLLSFVTAVWLYLRSPEGREGMG